MTTRHRINIRTTLVVTHDILAAALAWFGAFWLRFNFQLPEPVISDVIHTLIFVVPIQGAIFWAMGLYRGIWRYASLPDLKRILTAIGIASLIVPLVLIMFRLQTVVPRSVLLLAPILLTGAMCGSRVAYRAWREHDLSRRTAFHGEPVIVLGAGDAAVTFLKELPRSKKWKAVGLLDDDPAKRGRVLHGVRVLGGIEEFPAWADNLQVRHAIVAMPSASRSVRRKAMEMCASAGASVMTVPSFDDLMSGRLSITSVRNIQVEDLLGRDSVELDARGMHDFLAGQVIFVTGAGGSIGSELCRQIVKYKPKLIVFYEISEFALYKLQEEFNESFPGIETVCAVGDVKNAGRVQQVIAQYLPSVIFHAAAYKHVPMMEQVNAWEAVQNNVFGTYVVATAAIKHRVKKFVLISTDKAVNPTNVMGATKRSAEIVCQILQRTSSTRFEMVRFGNVLGSTGSVIPKFHEQIARGGPVTVTHPDIIRYFMSIPEAAQLVLQAGCMGQGGELFVMDMGEPVKIADLARQMIRLSGYSEDEIGIVYTGLRPGEKLYEELLADNEQTRPSEHPKLRVAKASNFDFVDLNDLVKWLSQSKDLSDDEVRRDLRRWVPEYTTAMKPKLKVV